MMSRLRYRCRRGTKELDIVLLRFLDERFEALSEPEQEAFSALLEEQDPDVSAWLWGGVPAPQRLREIVAKVQGVIGNESTVRALNEGSPLPRGGEGQGEGGGR